MGHTDRSHYAVTHQFSPTTLCQCVREHRNLPRLGRLHLACCTRCMLARGRVASAVNAILLQMDGRLGCALRKSTRPPVAISPKRVCAASTLPALRPLPRSTELQGFGRVAE